MAKPPEAPIRNSRKEKMRCKSSLGGCGSADARINRRSRITARDAPQSAYKTRKHILDAAREIHEARLEGCKHSPVSSVGLKLGAEERVQWTGRAFTDCVFTLSEKLLVRFAVEIVSLLVLDLHIDLHIGDLHIGIYVHAGRVLRRPHR